MNLNALSLQDGDDVIFNDDIIFKQPKVSDVKQFGEDLYMWFMMSWIRTPHDIMHHLWSVGIDYERLTKDELFISTVKQSLNVFEVMLKYFTNICGIEILYDYEYESELIYYNTLEDLKLRPITPNVFDDISYFIKNIHKFENKKPRKFSSISDRNKILAYEVEEMMMNSKLKDILGYISTCKQALVVYNSRTWDYVSSITVYQLISEISGINKLEESKRLYQGIYSGCVDISKIDKSLLDWIN